MDLGQVSSSKHPWDKAFVVCRWGGGFAQAADLCLCCSKKSKKSCHMSGDGCNVKRGGNGDYGGAREWTEDGRWRWMKKVVGVQWRWGLSMSAKSADCKVSTRWRGQRGRCRHNNQMKEEVAFGCPLTISDTRSVGGGASVECRRWRLGGAMGVQHCWRGSGGSASVGHRRQHIFHGGAAAVPSNARAAALTAWKRSYGGGIVGAAGGGSTSVGRGSAVA